MASSSIILSLDLSRIPDWILDAAPLVAGFKIGLRLFCSQGPLVLLHIPDGKSVFLDLKLFDIPNTIVEAITELRHYSNIRWITVSSRSGSEAPRRAHMAVAECFPSAEIVAVSRLTSDVGLADRQSSVDWEVDEDLRMARDVGVRCAVIPAACLPHFRGELRRDLWCDFTFFCPGIRLEDGFTNDHQSTATPKQAMEMGANYLIIGRPILRATDPIAQIERILKEIA